MLNKIAGALGQAADAAGTIVGIRHGTEEPAFTVEQRVGNVEIRRYGSRIAAETTIDADEEAARSEGFRRLARYIFGGNKSKTKVAMTAPVAQQQSEKIAMTAPVATRRGSGGEWVIRFYMPSEYTLDTLPTPGDERVRLVNVPAERVAVLGFSGIPSPGAVATKTDELMAAVRANSLAPEADPVSWFYDPPWTIPFRRRNEVAVSLGVDD
ncbi:MAG: heme-binding protein [Actinomycetia bacterium]|nr:heme-binding protein [Actinomycetes bacterium]